MWLFYYQMTLFSSGVFSPELTREKDACDCASENKHPMNSGAIIQISENFARGYWEQFYILLQTHHFFAFCPQFGPKLRAKQLAKAPTCYVGARVSVGAHIFVLHQQVYKNYFNTRKPVDSLFGQLSGRRFRQYVIRACGTIAVKG